MNERHGGVSRGRTAPSGQSTIRPGAPRPGRRRVRRSDPERGRLGARRGEFWRSGAEQGVLDRDQRTMSDGRRPPRQRLVYLERDDRAPRHQRAATGMRGRAALPPALVTTLMRRGRLGGGAAIRHPLHVAVVHRRRGSASALVRRGARAGAGRQQQQRQHQRDDDADGAPKSESGTTRRENHVERQRLGRLGRGAAGEVPATSGPAYARQPPQAIGESRPLSSGISRLDRIAGAELAYPARRARDDQWIAEIFQPWAVRTSTMSSAPAELTARPL